MNTNLIASDASKMIMPSDMRQKAEKAVVAYCAGCGEAIEAGSNRLIHKKRVYHDKSCLLIEAINSNRGGCLTCGG